MTDSGKLHYFLGIAITRNASGLFLSQRNYAADILHRANMTNCSSCTTPADSRTKLDAAEEPFVPDPTLYRSLAGALQYLTFTRPDISFAVQQICLFMHDPRETHLAVLKCILRYIKGTLDYGLQLYPSTTLGRFPIYTTLHLRILHLPRDNLISWSSKRQHTVSRSNAESEYRGVANVIAKTT
ncbi:PREDICTED: uncharacterized protein LOC109125969 [Camelina sativa]|uniref:Uncharacterized protein LOC109125969 n=1 Tax=Camelina sativa TaxID=90675 RepID=A0ABM1QC52_CAMSA|nr:PREDICTED: uncharacterized protein LOC109125969 [Camelina sativa]